MHNAVLPVHCTDHAWVRNCLPLTSVALWPEVIHFGRHGAQTLCAGFLYKNCGWRQWCCWHQRTLHCNRSHMHALTFGSVSIYIGTSQSHIPLHSRTGAYIEFWIEWIRLLYARHLPGTYVNKATIRTWPE